MNRVTPRVVAVALLFAATAMPAVAQVAVRVKNVGRLPVYTNALSGNLPNRVLSGGRTLAANGIAQFSVKAGTFTAAAARPNAVQAVKNVRTFQTRTFRTIYLEARQDNVTATITGAPPGVKF